MFSWIRTHKIFTSILAVLLLPVIFLLLSNYVAKIITTKINNTINTEASDLSQCKVLPVGKNACGKTAGYIIYSVETTDMNRYNSLVATREKVSAITTPVSKLLRWLLTDDSDLLYISTCDLEMPPAIEIVDGKCTRIEPKTEGYYESFREKCAGSSCCLSSVRNAEQANSLIYERNVTNATCPGGLTPVMNKCIDSYKWCLSATK